MLNLYTSRILEQVGGRWCLRPPPTCEMIFTMWGFFKNFLALRLSKACLWVLFHQASAYKMSKVCLFWAFRASRLWKVHTFVKTVLWVLFHQAGSLVKWVKFAFDGFSSFKGFKPWGRPILLKEVFEYIFTKRAAYKMSKVCIFKL